MVTAKELEGYGPGKDKIFSASCRTHGLIIVFGEEHAKIQLVSHGPPDKIVAESDGVRFQNILCHYIVAGYNTAFSFNNQNNDI